ncbi:MAG: Mur ligase family protein [Pseudomonadota bacterium]
MANLVLDDVRRLTGPNLLSDYPGSILDVSIIGFDTCDVVNSWRDHVRILLDQLDWSSESIYDRQFQNGASLAISSPIDALYTSCDVNELAWECTVAQLCGAKADIDVRLAELKITLAQERNLALLTLQRAAAEHNAPFLWDDDEVSVGHGAGTQLWPFHELPEPDEVNWSNASAVPCALITGTNGKSTSVRLASMVAEAAGISAGVTSTDFIRVGQRVLDHGDYSGPGGARMLLRHKDTELAFLEVARGGILRRGLPIDNAKAALITNIAADHLGEYGINTVADLAEVKSTVRKAIGAGGKLILNADDPLLVAQASNVNVPVCWFSLHADNITVLSHLEDNGHAVVLADDGLVSIEDGKNLTISTLSDVPMTMNGAAEHNVANALGVIGLCRTLGFSSEQIHQGLASFGSSADDNPGRGNVFDYDGASVMVDFAHNPHSVNAIVSTLSQLPAERRLVLLGHAGDRSEESIRQLARAAHALGVDQWVVADLPNYLRGRQAGEVPAIICDELAQLGVLPESILRSDTVAQGARVALSWARNGDNLLLLALDDREEIFQMLGRE